MIKTANNYHYIRIVFCAVVLFASCQLSLIVAQNSKTQSLSLKQVLEQVKKYHPLSQQAYLQNDMAAAERLKAKGGFDPSISSSVQQKNFDNKSYYSLINGEVKVPTWIGADIKGGYDLNRGVFLGPENTTPSNGLIYAGISMPLGQGLLIDDRRADLKNANILVDLAKAKRIDMSNELMNQTIQTYWEWYRSYTVRQILRESYTNASQRFDAVKKNVVSGDRPSIDTVEAKIQIQNIELGLNQSEMEYIKASTIFSGYLWDASGNTQLSADVVPEISDENPEDEDISLLNTDIQPFTNDHPYLQQLRQKLLQLDLQRRLKKDKLKPKINIQYNPLAEAVGSDILTNYNINNYKWGLEFKMPLFLRKERGDIKLAELKLQETDLILRNKSIELENKYKAYITEWEATKDQIDIFRETTDLYFRMYNAERRLFDLGESSLFVVNAREQAYINAKIKLAELTVKNRMAYYSIFYFAGQLGDQ